MICPYFLIYHNQIWCRCADKESNCLAILEKCENKIGRIAYEDDLKEQND